MRWRRKGWGGKGLRCTSGSQAEAGCGGGHHGGGCRHQRGGGRGSMMRRILRVSMSPSRRPPTTPQGVWSTLAPIDHVVVTATVDIVGRSNRPMLVVVTIKESAMNSSSQRPPPRNVNPPYSEKYIQVSRFRSAPRGTDLNLGAWIYSLVFRTKLLGCRVPARF